MSAIGKKILIVENAISVGLSYQSWLRKDGLEAVHVTTGTQALEHLVKGEYQVV